MEAQEIDATLDELESRLDRLRSLYEQYFLGIEKIEPTVARKDVDRRFWLLRKTHIRNTARRFRLQVLIQRYNTFQQHWTRICREIENGTYVRHLLKVKKKLGEEPKTWAARKRLGLLRKGAPGEEEPADDAQPVETREAEPDLAGLLTGGDLDADVLAATAAAFEHAEHPRPPRPAAQQRFTLDDLGPLNLDFDDDGQPTLPPKAAPAQRLGIAPPSPKAPTPPTNRVAGPAKIPTFPPPVPIGDPSQGPAPQKPGLPRPGGRPPLPARPAIPGAPRMPTGLGARPASPASPASPAEPFPPAPSSPSSSPPPPPRPMPVARPGVIPAGANGIRPALSPRVPLPPRDPGAATAARPATARGAPAGPRAPGAAVPPPRVANHAVAAPGAPTSGAQAASGPRPGAPAPPAVRSQGASAPRDLSDERLKQLHQELSDAKRKLNLQSNVSLDALSRSLRDTERKLREEHKGRSVDFQVVVRDGKAVVKPIVKK